MTIDFTIGFIAHKDHDIMELTIPNNIEALCSNTSQRFDLVLIIDGAEDCDIDRVLKAARRWGIDEVRLRWRQRNCASGDAANNGHFHHLVEKTPFLLTIEEDVALFCLDPNFDILAEFRRLFDRHQDLCVATRMDDIDCWVWKLEEVGRQFEPGVRSVNRVASHFLVYDVKRTRRYLLEQVEFSPEIFHDVPDNWFNYEDLLSKTFAEPSGPGIAFVDNFPIQVYHCDRKIAPGSAHYTKSPAVKVQEFHERKKVMSRVRF